MVMHRYTIHCKFREQKAHHLDKNVDMVDDFTTVLFYFILDKESHQIISSDDESLLKGGCPFKEVS